MMGPRRCPAMNDHRADVEVARDPVVSVTHEGHSVRVAGATWGDVLRAAVLRLGLCPLRALPRVGALFVLERDGREVVGPVEPGATVSVRLRAA